jgi:hypothetical protein
VALLLGRAAAFERIIPGGVLITTRLSQNVDHIATLIDGTPQILLFAVDSNEDFVQVPDIAKPAVTPFQFLGTIGTGLLAPDSDCFITRR